MKLFLLTIFALIAISVAAPFGKAPACVRTATCGGNDWKLVNPAEAEERVELVFALHQNNLDVVEAIVKEVSNPRGKAYGKYLTFEELGKLTADAEAERVVKNWLFKNGVSGEHVKVTPNKEFLRAKMSVAVAEKLLSTQFFEFVSFAVKNKAIRTLEYTLPKEIANAVNYVANTVQFPVTLRPTSIYTPKSDASGETTISLLKSYYNIDKTSCRNSKTTQSVFESLGQSFSPDDLSQFQSQYNLYSNAVDTIIGPNNANICNYLANSCAEANLDVQYMMGLAQLANTTYWSIPSSNSDIFLEWAEAVVANSDPPLVHSISYGSIETEEDPDSMKSFNSIAMQLASRGLTIMVATGDDGVANFIARSDKSQCGFTPSYPAVAPYVTAVGATQGPEDGSAEIVCSSSTGGGITSGGGFSTVFEQQSWQSDDVNNYLKNGPNMPPTSKFSSGGRGYPDVAMMGHNYPIVDGGRTLGVSGTSAASPVFASLITLINDVRLSAGKSSLGFLNPTLYSLDSDVFNDITSGENNCCAGTKYTAVCCDYGFTATTGWDPTTGLGSVDYKKLSSALQDI